jgi:uncharacterized protein (TIGR02001 family)
MLRNLYVVASSTAVVITSSASFAEESPPAAEAAPASPWVGSPTLASDYIFRGLTQTNEKPALQGGLEYDHLSGVYAGFWGSSISWLSDYSTIAAPVSSSVEFDFYAGYRGKFNEDLGYDVGIYTYYYPGDYPSGFSSANTTEIYGSLAYKFLSLKYSHTLTNAFGFADTKNSGYLDLSANYEFVPSWLLNAHAGHQRIDGIGVASYTDWKLGITKNLDKGFAVAIAYFDTNADKPTYTNPNTGHFIGRSTGVITIGKSF